MNRYHFGCLFKDNSLPYPFPNTKPPKSSSGAAIIHKPQQQGRIITAQENSHHFPERYRASHVLEGTKAPFGSLKSRRQSQEKIVQLDEEEQIEFRYDDEYSEKEQSQAQREYIETSPQKRGSHDVKYNQPDGSVLFSRQSDGLGECIQNV